MANLKHMYIRIELAFWERTIPLLEQSELLHRVLGGIYRWVVDQRWILLLPRPIRWASAGVMIGFAFGLLGGILF